MSAHICSCGEKKDLYITFKLAQMRLLKLCCCLLLLSGVKESFGQNGGFTVTGSVKDATTHEPLIGVSIAVKGKTGTGTATGADGRFTLRLPSGNDTLLFRMMNYSARVVPINNRSTIDITLATSLAQLGEVLIVGYTEQSVKKNTAAIAKMDVAELKNNPNPNPVQAMQGKVAGVSIPINQGQPGIGAANGIDHDQAGWNCERRHSGRVGRQVRIAGHQLHCARPLRFARLLRRESAAGPALRVR